MIGDVDSKNTNNIDNKESTVQQKLKKSEYTEKLETCINGQEGKSEINNCTDNAGDIFSKSVIGTDSETVQKCAENENEIDRSSDSSNKSLGNKIYKNDKDTEQKTTDTARKDIRNRLFKILDSDSEDENIFNHKSKSKVHAICKSENEVSDSDQSDKFEKHKSNKRKVKKFMDSDSSDTSSIANDSDAEEKVSDDKKDTDNINNRYQSLVDSESDEEQSEDDKEQTISVKDGKKAKKQNEEDSKSKRMKVSLRASKEQAMKQIQSETQRLLRESEVSLPYHKPKQRTLQEFLGRKKIITALPQAPTMAAKLKMSSAIVDKALKEKEKEAEMFYKSSDSEEEADETNNESTKDTSAEIPKRDGVSRKLFIDNDISSLEDNVDNSHTNTIEDTRENLMSKEEIANNGTVNRVAENNANGSTIIEAHWELDNAKNKNEGPNIVVEIDKSNNIYNLHEKDSIEKEMEEKNEHTESGKRIADEVPDALSNPTNDYAKMVRKSLGMTDESDEYNEYGLPPPKFDDSPNIEEKKALLNIRSLKPKLRGTPGTVIDLSDDSNPPKTGLNALIDRYFCKHSKTTGNVKDTSEVTTTRVKKSPNGLSIIKETLPYRSPSTVIEDPKLKKPGAKLQHLKEQLKHKMALKREEEWKQREQELKEQEIEWNESINEDDNLDEPLSPNIEVHRSEDEELEEDDVPERKERKKRKSAFIDDEAEVSDDNMNESNRIEDDEEDEVQEYSEEDEECEKLVLEERDENSADDSNDVPKCKTFKRIVEPMDDDSKLSSIGNIEDVVCKDKRTTFSQINEMLDTSFPKDGQASDNESEIPVAQMRVENDSKHQISQASQSKNDTFDFVSPITQLTALNTDLEEEKERVEVEKSLFMDPMLIGSTQSQTLSQQIYDSKEQHNSRNKLFTDQSDVLLDEELMELASGKFPDDAVNMKLPKEPDVSESQLLELCSGTFSSQANDKETIDSIDISQNTRASKEREFFSSKEEHQLDKQASSWNKLRVVSSDEEDLPERETRKRVKRKVKQLDVSDDEEENQSVVSSVEEENENEDERYVDYDSEENEVIVPRKEIKKFAAKFLDEEAELSESDCDVSADEDEKDLDKLEVEDVDDEDIDERQMKNQIGKLHMRQLLDDDQKEVRMLQELLFEDGDLYSESGRERKFKWKNIDKQVDDSNSQPLEDKDGWVDLSDDENEAAWRKIRHEREKFLAEKMTNEDSEIENDLNDSQVFKFGLKVLKKRRIDEFQKEDTSVEQLDAKVESRIPHTIAEMLNSSKFNEKSRTIYNALQKRSFLARGEESLARLAAMARQKDAPLLSKAKNFVFAHIDLDTENESAIPAEATSKHPTIRANRK